MEKDEIIKKLSELGINTTNAYPKPSFMYNDSPSISMYKREFAENFYFYNAYDKKIYVLAKYADFETRFTKDVFKGAEKFIVPLNYCSVIWEDKPFEELEDVPFKDMTLRDYACIHLKVPKSEKVWLNNIIISSKDC